MSEGCRDGDSRVLFLDVDGVLNCCQNLHDVDADKIGRLRKIVNETGCRIVLSSNWRIRDKTRERLAALLREGGVSFSSWTPCLDRIAEDGIHVMAERGDEIQAWLDEHAEVTCFVILDDYSDMAHLQQYLVQTESFVGLTDELTDEVIRRLM